MKRIRAALLKFDNILLPEWTSIVFIFLVCFFSFGILMSRLGYFQDDWHHVFYDYWQGAAGLRSFLLHDSRPFAFVVYAFLFRVLGFAPSHWHWSLMAIRFLTVGMFWLSVRQLWPERAALTTWLALIFAIYPIFTLQPLSVAYSLHWTMYLLIMLSIFLMLYAIRHPKFYLPLTILAVLLQVSHLLLIEYFSGLELSRLIFLWFLFPELAFWDRIKKVLPYVLPFLIILLLYVIYRSSYGVIFGYDRFKLLTFFHGLALLPFGNLSHLVQFMFQDFLYIVFSPWPAAIDPSLIDFSRPSTYVIIGSIVVFAALALFLVSHLKGSDKENSAQNSTLAILFGGMLSVILATFPFWLLGLSIYQKNRFWSDRLALAAMVGASLTIVGMVYTLVTHPPYRNLVLSILLGLGVSLQVQTARSYQGSSDKQNQFYWQLYWRVPALEPNTLIIADQEVLYFMGPYPTAYAINLLYPQITNPPAASYWFNPGSKDINWPAFISGQPAPLNKYATTFNANIRNVVAINFNYEENECLHVLRPDYSDVGGLTAETYKLIPISNLSRILPNSKSVPPPDIFGSEPQHTWCYYYEKADLADQFKDWHQVADLWNQADQQGVFAHNGLELLPFIRAFATLNDWQTAQKITIRASTLPDQPISALCALWKNLSSTTQASSGRDQAFSIIKPRLRCQP
ncbi:MAG TPA: hypothetical protein VLX61_13415 [Anaerolineales bacterium]|nr:hypothetical protein [Anaerolineales bacterium]